MTRLDILQGTLDLLILRAVQAGPLHGYQIARTIKEHSDEVLQVEEGALYPALHRLQNRGWVTSEWGRSENGRRAKFYTLTRDGAKALKAESGSWSRYVEAVGKVLSDAPGRGA